MHGFRTWHLHPPVCLYGHQKPAYLRAFGKKCPMFGHMDSGVSTRCHEGTRYPQELAETGSQTIAKVAYVRGVLNPENLLKAKPNP
jgi:hypothetical protein